MQVSHETEEQLETTPKSERPDASSTSMAGPWPHVEVMQYGPPTAVNSMDALPGEVPPPVPPTPPMLLPPDPTEPPVSGDPPDPVGPLPEVLPPHPMITPSAVSVLTPTRIYVRANKGPHP